MAKKYTEKQEQVKRILNRIVDHITADDCQDLLGAAIDGLKEKTPDAYTELEARRLLDNMCDIVRKRPELKGSFVEMLGMEEDEMPASLKTSVHIALNELRNS